MKKRMRSGWHFMNQDEFEKIKQLSGMKISANQIAKILNRSSGTVAQIIKAKDFSDYKEKQAEYLHKWRKQTKGTPVSVPSDMTKAEQNHSISQTDLMTITNILYRIADALEAMEDHWRPIEGQKKRFGII